MDTLTKLNTLDIKRQNFEIAKKNIKKFSEETLTDLELEKVASDKSFGEFVGDLFCLRGFGIDHTVTGSELNNLTSQIQKHLIALNEIQRKFINEFKEIYNALEALDKDYILRIVASIEAINKNVFDIKKAEKDTKRLMNEHVMIIKSLEGNTHRIQEKFDGINISLTDIHYNMNKIQEKLNRTDIILKEVKSSQYDMNKIQEKIKKTDKYDEYFNYMYSKIQNLEKNIEIKEKVLDERTILIEHQTKTIKRLKLLYLINFSIIGFIILHVLEII